MRFDGRYVAQELVRVVEPHHKAGISILKTNCTEETVPFAEQRRISL